MSSTVTSSRSSLVAKAVMAVSGLMLFGFVLGHMAGNLKLYLGAESLNHYAEWLRTIGEPALPHGGFLWIARAGLLAAVFAHIASAWLVTRQSRAARAHRYAKRATVKANYATRTMRWGGVIILLFVLFHLAHYTWGWSAVHPDFVKGDVYHNVVVGFKNPLASGFYLLANLALGLHLFHGLWSMLQTLGLDHPRWNALGRRAALAFAVIVTAGNLSFPLAVLTGLVS